MAIRKVTLGDGREISLDSRRITLRDALAAQSADQVVLLALVARTVDLTTEQLQDLPIEDAMILIGAWREVVDGIPKANGTPLPATASGSKARRKS